MTSTSASALSPLARNARRISAPALIAFFALAAAGCFSLTQKAPEKRYFLVEARRGKVEAAAANAQPLEIRRFRASPGFAEANFIYRTGPQSWVADYYNEFFVPPAPMLTESTRRWLMDSGLFNPVFSEGASLSAPLLLEASITSLYADVTDVKKPRAVLELQVFVVDDSTPSPTAVFQAGYLREIPVDKAAPAEFAAGWNEALKSVLTTLEKDLRSASLHPAAP